MIEAEGEANTSPLRARWRADHLDGETVRLLDEDARWFLHQSLSTPCLDALESADGATITTTGGRRVLDFHGNAAHQVGFSNPRVIGAIVDQLGRLPFSTRRYTNGPAVELARRLAALSPGDLDRVLFTTGGATAISAAIQLARVATGRHKVVSMWDSFHGATLDAISVGGEAEFRAGIGPLLPGTEHVPPPDPGSCPFGCRGRAGACDLTCADYVGYVLDKEQDVAAVVSETVRSAPYVPPADYWRRIRDACDRRGTLLILDEIPTGLGRTGRFFAFERWGIVPDIVVLGKGLGGGIWPLAAIIAREGLNVASSRAIGHFTHEKNPVAAAAALATLDEIEERGLVARADELGAWTLARLREIAARHPIVTDVRGVGLLLGIELAWPAGSTGYPNAAEAVMYAALSRGLNAKTTMGRILQLTPPLTISDAEMARALEIVEASLGDVEAARAARPSAILRADSTPG